jgi:hypothetical protein
MVRPIELTDAISKSSEVGRIQQNLQMVPETLSELQKNLIDREKNRQVNSPNPVNVEDQVVLHVTEKNEQQKNKEKNPDEKDNPEKTVKEKDKGFGQEGLSQGHIDIII